MGIQTDVQRVGFRGAARSGGYGNPSSWRMAGWAFADVCLPFAICISKAFGSVIAPMCVGKGRGTAGRTSGGRYCSVTASLSHDDDGAGREVAYLARARMAVR